MWASTAIQLRKRSRRAGLTTDRSA
jgi:hypothetical protein